MLKHVGSLQLSPYKTYRYYEGKSGQQMGTLKNPPKDVTVTITCNDAIATQTAAISGCKQPNLFQYPGTDGKISSSEWLVDVNCSAGEAGGLPGFPTKCASTGVGTRPLTANRIFGPIYTGKLPLKRTRRRGQPSRLALSSPVSQAPSARCLSA